MELDGHKMMFSMLFKFTIMDGMNRAVHYREKGLCSPLRRTGKMAGLVKGVANPFLEFGFLLDRNQGLERLKFQKA